MSHDIDVLSTAAIWCLCFWVTGCFHRFVFPGMSSILCSGPWKEPVHVQQTKWPSSLPNDYLYLASIWLDSWVRCNLTWNKVVAGLQLSILRHVEILWKATGRAVENRKRHNLTSRTGGGTMYQVKPNVLRETWQAFDSWLNIAFFFSNYSQWKKRNICGYMVQATKQDYWKC